MKKFTVVICNPTEPIGLGQKVYGGVVSAAYDRELSDAQPAVAVNEQDRLDAARYRWLRDSSVPPHNFYLSVPVEFDGVKYTPQEVDNYIDAAIAAAEAAKGGV